MKSFSCQCGNPLFFDNYSCLQCAAEVGFDPATLTMQQLGEGSAFKRCANGTDYQVCNWLLPADDTETLCESCRLNQVIPNLSSPQSSFLWAKTEAAKRRTIYSLLSAGLPLQPTTTAGLGAINEQGSNQPLHLSFRFMESLGGAPVMTGHDAGIITLNLEEADDAIRERNRQNLSEVYRTLLGHFRHEIGHYYWSMWFENDEKRDEVLPAFRELFGDERVSYDESMKAYYANGPSPTWQATSISAYSTMHPWEDWAETWAHYLHFTDALETFESLGLRKTYINAAFEADAEVPPPFGNEDPTAFLAKLQHWTEISSAINELSSSLGHNMLYPFVVSPMVVKKLFFIDCMIRRQAAELRALK